MLSNQDWTVLAVFSDGYRGNDAESSGTRTGETAGGNGSGEILEILKEEYGFSLIEADSCERARQIFESRADFSCVIVFYGEAEGRRDLLVLLQEIFANNEKIPVILFSENLRPGRLSEELLRVIDEFLCVSSGIPKALAGRIADRIRRYLDSVCPKFFGRMTDYAQKYR